MAVAIPALPCFQHVRGVVVLGVRDAPPQGALAGFGLHRLLKLFSVSFSAPSASLGFCLDEERFAVRGQDYQVEQGDDVVDHLNHGAVGRRAALEHLAVFGL